MEECSSSHTLHTMTDSTLPSNSDKRYIYTRQKIAGKQNATRLVHVLPGLREDRIECTLTTTMLDNPGAFEALSYVCGSSNDPKKVIVDGIPLEVTDNLYSALLHLRDQNSIRHLWVDAICINQFDTEERNEQVANMANVYRKAFRVLVWIGLETPSSVAAFRFMAHSYRRTPFNRKELTKDLGWFAMRDLYQREYWTRVWTVQEICLAREAIIVCGNSQIRWQCITELRKARQQVWTPYLSLGEYDFRRSPLALVDEIRAKSLKGGCSLWTSLECFRESQCQELHDKIYGFLGLCNDCGTSDVRVDYAMPVQDLLLELIEFYHRKFSRSDMDPGSSQLMAFSEFLQSYISGHPEYAKSVGCPRKSNHTRLGADPAGLSIPALAVFQIGGEPTLAQANEHGGFEMMEFLRGEVPYSHIKSWREKVDASLRTVYRIEASNASATISCAMPKIGPAIQTSFDRPSAVIAKHLVTSNNGNDIGSTVEVMGIVPPGSRIGDLICIFVESNVALVLTTAKNESQRLELVGRAELDVRQFLRNSPLGCRVTTDQQIGPTTTDFPVLSTWSWPLTLETNASCLQTMTKWSRWQRPQTCNSLQLDLLPQTRDRESLTRFD
jgi:hypothetical protein